jgi:hypothetical protein
LVYLVSFSWSGETFGSKQGAPSRELQGREQRT